MAWCVGGAKRVGRALLSRQGFAARTACHLYMRRRAWTCAIGPAWARDACCDACCPKGCIERAGLTGKGDRGTFLAVVAGIADRGAHGTALGCNVIAVAVAPGRARHRERVKLVQTIRVELYNVSVLSTARAAHANLLKFLCHCRASPQDATRDVHAPWSRQHVVDPGSTANYAHFGLDCGPSA